MFKKQNLKILLIILLGSLTWILTMFKSGLKYSFGLGFWGANGHDALWHLALSEELSKLSFNSPVFAGEAIKNYHLGFGVLLSFVNKITFIPTSTLYFQIFPILFSLLIGYLVYKFVFLWRGSKAEAFWSLVFVYFGTGLGMIVTFARSGVLTGESMFWSQQAISTLINPPFSLSLIVLLLGLISLLKYLKGKKTRNLIIASLLFGILIQVKSYAGVLALGGLGVGALWGIFRRRYSLLKVAFLSGVISILIFLPFVKESAGILTFQPFWFLETMMTYSDRLGWDRFYSAMTTWVMGKIWLKAAAAYTIAFVIFVIGNMGTRIISVYALIQSFRKKIKVAEIEVILGTIATMALTIPMFFVQEGTPWNTIQFFYYFLFVTSLWAGISISLILKKAKTLVKVLTVGTVGIFCVLGAVSSLGHYLPKTPPAMLPNSEIEALTFLSKQPDGVVLTFPFDIYKSKAAEAVAPRPLYLYESTAYVSAFSKKEVFLEDEVNLNITGYLWQERKKAVLDFYDTLDEQEAYDFLRENNISYVYWLKDQHGRVGDFQMGLTKIFDNKEVTIFKLNEI